MSACSFAFLLGSACAGAALADPIFVLTVGTSINGAPPPSSIGEYTTSGATVNAPLIPGLLFAPPFVVSGSDLFLVNIIERTISEYNTTSGAVVNAALTPQPVAGFAEPSGLAVSGSDLFVLYTMLNDGSAYISEYTTSGTLVNPSLISIPASNYPEGIVVSGSSLFVVNTGSSTIGEYTTSGATVNASLISGLNDPDWLAISGSDLFVVNTGIPVCSTCAPNATSIAPDTVGEYTTSGATVNTSLISGFSGGIAASGSDIFLTNAAAGTIAEYDSSGALVNGSLISGLIGPEVIAIPSTTEPVPEPGTLLLMGTALLGMGCARRHIRER